MESHPAITLRDVLSRIAAIILWLGSVVIGLVGVYYIRSIFAAIFVRFSDEIRVGGALSSVILVVASLGWLVFVVVTGEYHAKHAGTTGSWKLFAISYIVLIAIPIIAYFIG